jgi:hypothetical protein
MSEHVQNRRRKMVVNKLLQGRLVLNISLFPILGLVAAIIAAAVFCTALMHEEALAETDAPSMVPLFYLVLAFELLAGGFFVFSALRESHRIAGPAYRICESLKRMREGDVSFTVTLRPGDRLTEVRDEVNLLLDRLNENPPPGFVTRSTAAQKTQQQAPGATRAAAPAEEPVGAGS